MQPRHLRVVAQSTKRSLQNPNLRHAIHKEIFQIVLIPGKQDRHVLMIIPTLILVEMNLMDRLLCL